MLNKETKAKQRYRDVEIKQSRRLAREYVKRGLRYWRGNEVPNIGTLECWVDQRFVIQGRVAETIRKNESARPREAYADR
jgi:hypothetical protein